MDEGSRTSAPPRSDRVISEERFRRYHEYARRHGVNRLIYTVARAMLQPAFWIWLRLSKTGREHFRGIEGGLIVAANHRSFLDPFVIGASLPWRRPMQFVAKVELFERRWQGWILSRVGAFPIRRGQSDETAMETAAVVLDRSGTICIFPEGTRIRSGSLATPRRGVGRLALETGAAVVPVAVHGSERVRRGVRIRPRKVKLRVRAPDDVPAHRAPVAGAGRDRDESHLAEHRAAVGVAWRAAAASQGGRDRRRELGNRDGGAARAWRPRRPARAPARRTRRPGLPPAREPALPAGRAAARERVGQARRRYRARRGATSYASRSRPSALPAVVGATRRIGGLARGRADADQGLRRSRWAAAERVRVGADPRPGDRVAGRTGARPRGGGRDGRARARHGRCRPARAARGGLRSRRAGLRAKRATSPGWRWRASRRTRPRWPRPRRSRTV